MCAVQLAHRIGARLIGTIRSQAEEENARSAGADDVVLNDANFTSRVMSIAPEGVDHIVEVAFAANVASDIEILKQGGSISTYATNAPTLSIPFWEMVFKNVRLFFLGNDDFPIEAKIAAAKDLSGALEADGEDSLSPNVSPSSKSLVLTNWLSTPLAQEELWS